ncbi:MAG: hypothetical protein CVU11_01795 [Bacteroidetes bacterium HGW-Bacteroidetes-6]|jgi:cell division protein FtsQ|nr:MAG: hypothetical protein CVU11_01795 [Bacteroidetes bacterium HGW-Bacteroidetes-6]
MKLKYKILILLGVAICIFMLIRLANSNFRKQKISQVTVSINTQGGPELVTEEEVLFLISQGYDSLTSRTVGEIDLAWIENIAKTNPYVQSVDAFINIDASLTVSITQRKPILRVFNSHNQSFYVDTEGALMPLNQGGSPGLLIASGEIDEKYYPSAKYSYFDSINYNQAQMLSVMNKLYLISMAINSDSLLCKLITQVFVSAKNNFELIPAIGDQNILLGDVDELRTKLKNLSYFYKEGYTITNFSKYKTFDIRFNNQVVCIKKDEI